MTATTVKRLYKSRTDRMIDGVCGGIAEYFGLDATLVRVAWVFLTLLGGSGIILYILAMIIMPVEPSSVAAAEGTRKSSSGLNQKFWGILLVTAGLFWLAGNLGLAHWRHWWSLGFDIVLPVVLILAGVGFLWGGRNFISTPTLSSDPLSSDPDPTGAPETTDRAEPSGTARRLFRSRGERKLFGVCGGLATYFNVDPTIVRLLFVISAIASFGFTVLAYVVMAIVVPEEPLATVAS